MGFVDFTHIDKVLNAVLTLDENKVWFFSVDKDVQDEIIRLNTEEQLEEQGTDSLGRQLGKYSPLTIMYKRLKGDRFDHITLKDTGEFYDSFTVVVHVNEIVIDANDQKDDTALFEVYGVDVLGITEDNMKFIKEMILENYIKFLQNEIFQ